MPDFSLETRMSATLKGSKDYRIVGIDEAGRGPWAGPVVAAAVWLDAQRCPESLLSRLDDSKKLSANQRDRLFAELSAGAEQESAAIGLGLATVVEIDRLNILQASLLAMARAVDQLQQIPSAALVDGNKLPALPCRAEAVVKGDGKSFSIAAASVIAKVTRDRIMADLARRHPGYGWERNRGYGTAEHRAALSQLGVTAEHRRSFRPVRETLSLTI